MSGFHIGEDGDIRNYQVKQPQFECLAITRNQCKRFHNDCQVLHDINFVNIFSESVTLLLNFNSRTLVWDREIFLCD